MMYVFLAALASATSFCNPNVDQVCPDGNGGNMCYPKSTPCPQPPCPEQTCWDLNGNQVCIAHTDSCPLFCNPNYSKECPGMTTCQPNDMQCPPPPCPEQTCWDWQGQQSCISHNDFCPVTCNPNMYHLCTDSNGNGNCELLSIPCPCPEQTCTDNMGNQVCIAHTDSCPVYCDPVTQQVCTDQNGHDSCHSKITPCPCPEQTCYDYNGMQSSCMAYTDTCPMTCDPNHSQLCTGDYNQGDYCLPNTDTCPAPCAQGTHRCHGMYGNPDTCEPIGTTCPTQCDPTTQQMCTDENGDVSCESQNSHCPCHSNEKECHDYNGVHTMCAPITSDCPVSCNPNYDQVCPGENGGQICASNLGRCPCAMSELSCYDYNGMLDSCVPSTSSCPVSCNPDTQQVCTVGGADSCYPREDQCPCPEKSCWDQNTQTNMCVSSNDNCPVTCDWSIDQVCTQNGVQGCYPKDSPCPCPEQTCWDWNTQSDMCYSWNDTCPVTCNPDYDHLCTVGTTNSCVPNGTPCPCPEKTCGYDPNTQTNLCYPTDTPCPNVCDLNTHHVCHVAGVDTCILHADPCPPPRVLDDGEVEL